MKTDQLVVDSSVWSQSCDHVISVTVLVLCSLKENEYDVSELTEALLLVKVRGKHTNHTCSLAANECVCV